MWSTSKDPVRERERRRAESIVTSSSSRMPDGQASATTRRANTNPNVGSSTSEVVPDLDRPERRYTDPERRRERSRSRDRIDDDEKDISRRRRRSRSRDRERRKHRSRSRDGERHKHRSQSRDRDEKKRDKKERREKGERKKRSSRSSTGDSVLDSTVAGSVAGPSSGTQSFNASAYVPDQVTEQASSHVIDQFPGQFPSQSAEPYRPPVAASEGGPGLAAEYYGDQGQSVADQPGVRPGQPDLIIGAEPHLLPASAVSAPPPEPSSTGGVGAAASFYSGESGSKPPTPGVSPRHSPRPGTGQLAGAAGVGAATAAYAASASGSASTSFYQSAASQPPSAYDGGSDYPVGHHSASAPAVPTLGAAAAGMAAGYLAGQVGQGHHIQSGQSGQPGQPIPGPATSYQAQIGHHSQTVDVQPHASRPGKHSSHSNTGLYAAGAAAGAVGIAAAAAAHHHHDARPGNHQHHQHHPTSGSGYLSGSTMYQQQRRRGPLDKFVDFWRDPDGVGRFEDYTEFMGVCKYCFEPGSTPRDAPRKHNRRRRRGSNERFGSSTRIDKDSRYHSSDGGSKSKRKGGESWLTAGLAGYGLAKVGKTLFNQTHDFNDTYSVRTGNPSDSRLSLLGNDSSVSVDVRTRTSRGSDRRTRSRSRSGSRRRSRSRDKTEVGVTKDGRVYKRETKEGIFGGTSTSYVEPTREKSRRHHKGHHGHHSHRRSRHSKSRSRSTSPSSRRKGEIALAGVSGVVLASSSAAKHHRRSSSVSPKGEFVRKKRSGRDSSPDGGLRLGRTVDSRRTDERSPTRSYGDFPRPSRDQASNIVGRVIAASPDRRQKRSKKRSKKGFFNFGGSSSSSLSSSPSSSTSHLAYDEGSDGRNGRKGNIESKSKGRKANNAALLGLGTVAAAMAATSMATNGKSPSPLALAVKNSRDARHRENRARHSSSSSSDDEGWESASDDDDNDSDLAFGSIYGRSNLSLNRKSQESLVSDASSGTGKWGWRWGSSKSKRKSKGHIRHDDASQGITSIAGPVMTGAAGAALAGTVAHHRHENSMIGSQNSLPSMQNVLPDPIPDPHTFNVRRSEPLPSLSQPIHTSRPAPVPLQQPQPYVPVASTIYNGDGVSQRNFAHPSTTSMVSQRRRSQGSSAITGYDVEPSQTSRPPANPFDYQVHPDAWVTKDEIQNQTVTSRRRRDSSPTMGTRREAQVEVRRRSSARDPTIGVRFDLPSPLPSPDEKSTDLARKQEGRYEDREIKSRREQMRLRDAEEKAAQDKARERARAERRREKASEDAADPKKASRRDETDQSAWVAPTVAGVVGAATVAAVTHSMRSKPDGPDKPDKAGYETLYDVQRDNDEAVSLARKSRQRGQEATIVYSSYDPDDYSNVPSVMDKYSIKEMPMSAYFAPPELLGKSAEPPKVPVFDEDLTTFGVPEIVTVAPRDMAGPSALDSGPSKRGFDPSFMTLPWSVPSLNLICPTPPPPMDRVSAQDLERFRTETPGEPNEESTSHPAESTSREVPRKAEDEDRHQAKIRKRDKTAARKARNESSRDAAISEEHSTEASISQSAPTTSKEQKAGTLPGKFPDDLDFAATLAAGLEDTGFDPSIVIDDPAFRRRTSPPGSEDEIIIDGAKATKTRDAKSLRGKGGQSGLAQLVQQAVSDHARTDPEPRETVARRAEIVAEPESYSTTIEAALPSKFSDRNRNTEDNDEQARAHSSERSIANNGVSNGVPANVAADVVAVAITQTHRDSAAIGDLSREISRDSVTDDVDEFTDAAEELIRERTVTPPRRKVTVEEAPVEYYEERKSKGKKSKRSSKTSESPSEVLRDEDLLSEAALQSIETSKRKDRDSKSRRDTEQDYEVPKKKGKKSKSRRDTEDEFMRNADASRSVSNVSELSRHTSNAEDDGDGRERKSRHSESKDERRKRRKEGGTDSGRDPQDLISKDTSIVTSKSVPDDGPTDRSVVRSDFPTSPRKSASISALTDAGTIPQMRSSEASDATPAPTFRRVSWEQYPFLADMIPPPSLPPSGPASPVQFADFGDLPVLPESREGSPTIDEDNSSRRLSGLKQLEGVPSAKLASPTAIPLLFKRPPTTPGVQRSSSVSSSPTMVSPAALGNFVRPRHGKSSSNDYKRSSREFRPLYLVERLKSKQDTDQDDEVYPSLPSSHTTTRSPSLQGVDDDGHAVTDDVDNFRLERDVDSGRFDALGMRIDTGFRDPREEFLGSQQATPKASSFSDADKVVDREQSLDYLSAGNRPDDELPTQQTDAEPSPPHSPTRLVHGLDDLFPNRKTQTAKPSTHQAMEGPPQRASSPVPDRSSNTAYGVQGDKARGLSESVPPRPASPAGVLGVAAAAAGAIGAVGLTTMSGNSEGKSDAAEENLSAKSSEKKSKQSQRQEALEAEISNLSKTDFISKSGPSVDEFQVPESEETAQSELGQYDISGSPAFSSIRNSKKSKKGKRKDKSLSDYELEEQRRLQIVEVGPRDLSLESTTPYDKQTRLAEPGDRSLALDPPVEAIEADIEAEITKKARQTSVSDAVNIHADEATPLVEDVVPSSKLAGYLTRADSSHGQTASREVAAETIAEDSSRGKKGKKKNKRKETVLSWDEPVEEPAEELKPQPEQQPSSIAEFEGSKKPHPDDALLTVDPEPGATPSVLSQTPRELDAEAEEDAGFGSRIFKKSKKKGKKMSEAVFPEELSQSVVDDENLSKRSQIELLVQEETREDNTPPAPIVEESSRALDAIDIEEIAPTAEFEEPIQAEPEQEFSVKKSKKDKKKDKKRGSVVRQDEPPQMIAEESIQVEALKQRDVSLESAVPDQPVVTYIVPEPETDDLPDVGAGEVKTEAEVEQEFSMKKSKKDKKKDKKGSVVRQDESPYIIAEESIQAEAPEARDVLPESAAADQPVFADLVAEPETSFLPDVEPSNINTEADIEQEYGIKKSKKDKKKNKKRGSSIRQDETSSTALEGLSYDEPSPTRTPLPDTADPDQPIIADEVIAEPEVTTPTAIETAPLDPGADLVSDFSIKKTKKDKKKDKKRGSSIRQDESSSTPPEGLSHDETSQTRTPLPDMVEADQAIIPDEDVAQPEAIISAVDPGADRAPDFSIKKTKKDKKKDKKKGKSQPNEASEPLDAKIPGAWNPLEGSPPETTRSEEIVSRILEDVEAMPEGDGKPPLIEEADANDQLVEYNVKQSETEKKTDSERDDAGADEQQGVVESISPETSKEVQDHPVEDVASAVPTSAPTVSDQSQTVEEEPIAQGQSIPQVDDVLAEVEPEFSFKKSKKDKKKNKKRSLQTSDDTSKDLDESPAQKQIDDIFPDITPSVGIRDLKGNDGFPAEPIVDSELIDQRPREILDQEEPSARLVEEAESSLEQRRSEAPRITSVDQVRDEPVKEVTDAKLPVSDESNDASDFKAEADIQPEFSQKKFKKDKKKDKKRSTQFVESTERALEDVTPDAQIVEDAQSQDLPKFNEIGSNTPDFSVKKSKKDKKKDKKPTLLLDEITIEDPIEKEDFTLAPDPPAVEPDVGKIVPPEFAAPAELAAEIDAKPDEDAEPDLMGKKSKKAKKKDKKRAVPLWDEPVEPTLDELSPEKPSDLDSSLLIETPNDEALPTLEISEFSLGARPDVHEPAEGPQVFDNDRRDEVSATMTDRDLPEEPARLEDDIFTTPREVTVVATSDALPQDTEVEEYSLKKSKKDKKKDKKKNRIDSNVGAQGKPESASDQPVLGDIDPLPSYIGVAVPMTRSESTRSGKDQSLSENNTDVTPAIAVEEPKDGQDTASARPEDQDDWGEFAITKRGKKGKKGRKGPSESTETEESTIINPVAGSTASGNKVSESQATTAQQSVNEELAPADLGKVSFGEQFDFGSKRKSRELEEPLPIRGEESLTMARTPDETTSTPIKSKDAGEDKESSIADVSTALAAGVGVFAVLDSGKSKKSKKQEKKQKKKGVREQSVEAAQLDDGTITGDDHGDKGRIAVDPEAAILNRDSAVHGLDSPSATHDPTDQVPARDSGYHDVAESPTLQSHKPPSLLAESTTERRPSSGLATLRSISPEVHPADHARGRSAEPRSPQSTRSQDSLQYDATNASSRDPLNISVELDPMYDRGVEITFGPRESGSELAASTDHGALQSSREASPVRVRSVEEYRSPSPVHPTSKERSSGLFKSSPFSNDQRTPTEVERSRRDVYNDVSSEPSRSRGYREDGRGGADEVADDYASPKSKRRSPTRSAEETNKPRPSLFGGPIGPNSDMDMALHTPLGSMTSEKRPLHTIPELGADQDGSPLAKRSRSRTDGQVSTLPEASLNPYPGAGTSLTPSTDGRGMSADPGGFVSTDDVLSRLSWPSVDETEETVNIERVKSRDTDRRSSSRPSDGSTLTPDQRRRRDVERRSPSGHSVTPDLNVFSNRRSPGSDTARSVGSATRSSRGNTPPLRRVDRSASGDLRSASKLGLGGRQAQVQQQQAKLAKDGSTVTPATPASTTTSRLPLDLIDQQQIPSSSTYDPVNDKGKSRVRDMADVYEGWGDVPGSPMSPNRPQSMRRRQSTQILDLESRLEQLAADNRSLQDAKIKAERGLEDVLYNHNRSSNEQAEALESHRVRLGEAESEIAQLRQNLDWFQSEVKRLTEINAGLTTANVSLASAHDERYELLHAEHTGRNEQLEQTTRELEDVRQKHGELSGGMEALVREEIGAALRDKNAELDRLRDELDAAKEQIRTMQRQILESKSGDDFLVVRDEDYFEGACQQLCQRVQQWVLRYSKFSDMRGARLADEISDDKVVDRLENAILDGSDVDDCLTDRVRRRDVFMSVVMTMVWEFVFTRYLFGMDREQRQKLKSLEKLLSEVGPAAAVHRWRATTLTLLSQRPASQAQREQDTEAVVQEVYSTLAAILPPPSNLSDQIQDSLRNVMRTAVELSIEMRTQQSEYMMLPPLQPEYDGDGEVARKVSFNATLMNERGSGSGAGPSNEELEAQQAVVKMVLFPLVVRKGDDPGASDDEVVIYPAQVLVARAAKEKKVVRVVSGDMMAVDQQTNNRSSHSVAPSTLDMGNVI
ncbi:MAG: hypothetical protein M1825_001718 [Sarcosagium campestre]|nr:MAG: hypothetical protein M1825_001718 [Sarcosagium campestre]